MDADMSPKPLLLAIVMVILLISPVFVSSVCAQTSPAVGPSARPMEDGPTADDQAPVIAPGIASVETFGAEGGADVQLGGNNEPAVAVNPLNENNIAVAVGGFRLRVSTDKGVTFSAATLAVVPATHSRCGDPSVAFDSRGRLFWAYLGCIFDAQGQLAGIDMFIAQADPATGAILAGYPINVTASPGVNLPASLGFLHDKEWLAADRFPTSPFRDRLYLVWTRLDAGAVVLATFSADQGQTWSAALPLSAGGEGFVWPSHNAVAPNGDVYVSYHSQPFFAGNPPAPNGTSGQVFVLRSTTGGAAYPQKTSAYTAGNADITFNVQDAGTPRQLNGSVSWTQGSAQAWVLPDPIRPNHVYVVAADDLTNLDHGAGFDDMDVFIVRSTDNGLTWSAPARVNMSPAGSTQFFPTAGIDDKSGCLTVTWYDTKGGELNDAANFLLDMFMRSSFDGGLTFGPEVQINDVLFDPDLGAPSRFDGPPPTLRIGEYNGVAVANGTAHAVWTGNTLTGQQTLYDNATVCEVDAFPNTQALVGFRIGGQCTTLIMGGPSKVVVDINGINADPATGNDRVATEMVQLELRGFSPALGGEVFLRLRSPLKSPFMRTVGMIEETANATPGTLDLSPFILAPDCGPCTADSFFDVFFEVQIGANGPIFHNERGLPMVEEITHKPPEQGNVYKKPTQGLPLELFDEQNNQVPDAFLVQAKHSPAPPRPCDADLDGDVDSEDITLIMAGRNTPAVPGDVRDIDHDGRITVVDARRCALRCDRLRCAVVVSTPPLCP